MRRRHKFLRKVYKMRRMYKEFPYGGISNVDLLNVVEDDIRTGRDFINEI